LVANHGKRARRLLECATLKNQRSGSLIERARAITSVMLSISKVLP
jgi:hypothetical protein